MKDVGGGDGFRGKPLYLPALSGDEIRRRHLCGPGWCGVRAVQFCLDLVGTQVIQPAGLQAAGGIGDVSESISMVPGISEQFQELFWRAGEVPFEDSADKVGDLLQRH